MHANFLKLWDKGVDIAANVITSVIVVLLGLAFWNVKLWLDLRADERKQRQQHRVAEELAQAKGAQEAQEQYERLCSKRETMASAAATAGRLGLCQLWISYLDWLKSNDLLHSQRNLEVASELAQWHINLATASDANVEASQRNMARTIRETVIPKPQEGEN